MPSLLKTTIETKDYKRLAQIKPQSKEEVLRISSYRHCERSEAISLMKTTKETKVHKRLEKIKPTE